MVNDFHLKRVCSLMENHGGEVIIGNKNAHIDFDLKPTIILNPSKDSKLMKEEIFGPIFPIILYTNIDEAIKYISEEQEKPLTVYYFGQRNGTNQEKVINGTSSGSLVVNDTIYQIMNAYLPFGGVGLSGYGRYHGEEGFKSFSNMKSILVKPSLDCFPFD
jgi:aldehyde dehydrogenase (NAD+)